MGRDTPVPQTDSGGIRGQMEVGPIDTGHTCQVP